MGTAGMHHASATAFGQTLHSLVDFKLPWLPFHVAICVTNLLFIFIWSLGVLRKPFTASVQADQKLNGEDGKSGSRVVTTRAREYFTAGIVLSACLFVLNLYVGVRELLSRWVPEWSTPPIHEELAMWTSAVAWLILTMEAYFNRKEKKDKFPSIVRAWWIAAFLSSILCLGPNIMSYRDTGRFTAETWLEILSVPATAYLFIAGVLGRTGVKTVKDDALNEPLLGEKKAAADVGVTPYATAGIFSLICLSWLTPLLATGYKKPLEQPDVPLLAPEDRSGECHSKLKYNWDKQLEYEGARKCSPLLVAMIKTFWRSAAFNAVVAGTNAVAGYIGPFLVEDFVEYLAGRRRFAYEGYVLILCFFVGTLMETVSARAWYLGMQILGLRFKSSLTALVYTKGLRLSNDAKQGHTSGEIINYVSVDVQRIGDFCWYMHEIWVIPLQVTLALLILYKVVGAAAIASLLAACIVVLANIPLAKLQDTYQDKLMEAKDKRMKTLTESLRSMLVLKLQAWETEYLAKIVQLRSVEYRYLKTVLFASASTTFVFWAAPMLVSVVTFGTCILLGTPLTAGRILSALATLRVMQEPLVELPELISTTIQTKVSMDRLRKYLVEEELQKDAVTRVPTTSGGEMAVEIDKASFKWSPSAATPTLHGVDLHVKRGKRVAICGTVGAGKSSLLLSILGEISRVSGEVKVYGKTVYVAQTGWIQSGKIEDNILFGDPMDRRKYNETLRVCSLHKDMELFAHGDQTVIGERGINLSGGQKQRLQLARAIYKDADIYLLDDPFSAVDAHTGSDLFQNCILRALSGKTVLYVTHQVEFLPAADIILVVRDGKIVQTGKYDELRQSGTDFNNLVNAHNEAIDSMGSSGYEREVKEGTTETRDSEAQAPAELLRQFSRKKSMEETVPVETKRQLVEDEERERGNVTFALFWTYLTAVYKGALIPMIILLQVGFQVVQIASNYWMAWASPASAGEVQKVDNTLLILVYSILSLAAAAFVTGRAFLTVITGLLAAQKYFTNMLRALFHAPMSFFDSTPTGRILSRASSDQTTLDTEITFTLSVFMWTTIQLFGIIIVMCQIAWQIFALFVPVIVACIMLQRYYIKTARELQRLSGIAKSPILHHYGESLAGAVTIRGFGQQQRFLETNLKLYDKFGAATFHNFASIQWLMFRMEMLSTFVFAISLIYTIAYIGDMDPGIAGLAVTYGLQLNTIQSWCVWTMCNLENRIISVERITQYTRVESEAPLVIEESRPPAEWPNRGRIELQNLQVRYNDHSPFVLHGVTCTFLGGEKIGIVGRTGCGKSTLIQTLFRIVEPSSGRIVIDGIDITKIGLHDLRNKLSIIPQDPTLFEGTMRGNLDPLQRHSDAQVWEALDKCQLGDLVRSKEEKLDCPVNENGENWSVGQRQLVCLGRALLQRTTILVLDEATASVDTATDGVIQRTVRSEFRQCTVITVAHRIPTVVDSDKALVLNDGRIAEYDSPQVLLKNTQSLFYKLVSEYWTRSSSAGNLVNLE